MELFQLMSLLETYVAPFIFGLFGALSLFFYAKTKKKGFVMFGIAFVFQTAFYVTSNAISSYFRSTLILGKYFPFYFDLESSFIFASEMIFVMLLLVGIIFLYNEVKPKTTLPFQDAKS